MALNKKANYHYGFNFSDPLASIIYQNYLSLYDKKIDVTEIFSIVDDRISIKFLETPELINVIKKFSDDNDVLYDGDDYIFIKNGCIFKMDYTTRKQYIDLKIYVYSNSYTNAKENFDIIDSYLSDYKINISSFSIDWKYKSGVYSTTEYVNDIIHPEAYPNIEDIDLFVDDYLKSEESILIFRGETGSGKTRLIRSILREYSAKNGDASVLYTMDDKLLMDDGFFVDFLNSNYDILVLEDLDEFLRSRKEGNTMMSKLLTVSDGVVQTMDKKIIISTNLNTVEEFDKALLRGGRCYANVRFRKLSWKESKSLILKLDKDFDVSSLKKTKYSVADIYGIVAKKDIKAEQEDDDHSFYKQPVGFTNN